jgi:hypothetical protein
MTLNRLLRALGLERRTFVNDEILLEAPIEASDEVGPILKEMTKEAERIFLKIVAIR